MSGNAQCRGKAFIIEDIREAEIQLKKIGYECDRITHSEVLSQAGTAYSGKLMLQEYVILWISSPAGWYLKTKGRKYYAHWLRLWQLMRIALSIGILLVVYGTPNQMWKQTNIYEILTEKTYVQRIRLCHLDLRYDKEDKKPSGSYLYIATNHVAAKHGQWKCKCGIPIADHVLDWYGREETRATWRQDVNAKVIEAICTKWLRNGHNTAIIDSKSLPSSTASLHEAQQVQITNDSTTTLPTEGRIKQKARLAELKEKGLAPKKKKIYTEAGDDDCGEDITGLGSDAILLMHDVYPEDYESSDGDSDLFLSIPVTPTNRDTTVLSAVATLCWGDNNEADLLELCGGEGRISTVAFQRGLKSGGNLDLTTWCDLGDPTTQRAVMHYLDKCDVLVTVLQPKLSKCWEELIL